MRVVLFEPDHMGHHFDYVRLIAQALVGLRGVDVRIILASGATKTVEFATHLSQMAGAAICESPYGWESGVWNAAKAKLDGLRWALREHRPDHVLLPYGDGLVQMLGARRLTGRRTFNGGTEVEALMMRGTFAYAGGERRLRERLRKLAWMTTVAAAPLQTLFVLDSLPYDVIRRGAGALARRTTLLADPVEPPAPASMADARRKLGIPTDGRYIGTAGVLNDSKGIDRFLEAFRAAPLATTDRLLLVGSQVKSVKSLLGGEFAPLRRSGRVVDIDGYVGRPTLEAAISACDVVCTPYPRHIGSASFAIRAAAAGRPILGSTFGWVGRTIPQFGLGSTCDVQNTDAFATAIRDSLDGSMTYEPGEAAKRFVRFHSPENFAAQWTQRLRERLALPPSGHLVDWNWVVEAARD